MCCMINVQFHFEANFCNHDMFMKESHKYLSKIYISSKR